MPKAVLAAFLMVPMAVHTQVTSAGIDCSQVAPLHLLLQENMRAGLTLMECGLAPRPVAARSGNQVSGDDPQPPNMLVSNRSCNSPNTCTKSTSVVWHSFKARDNTLVVNFNDHNGSGYSGTSYSTDNGAMFTQILPPPFSTGHGTNYGGPILVYNLKVGTTLPRRQPNRFSTSRHPTQLPRDSS